MKIEQTKSQEQYQQQGAAAAATAEYLVPRLGVRHLFSSCLLMISTWCVWNSFFRLFPGTFSFILECPRAQCLHKSIGNFV